MSVFDWIVLSALIGTLACGLAGTVFIFWKVLRGINR